MSAMRTWCFQNSLSKEDLGLLSQGPFSPTITLKAMHFYKERLSDQVQAPRNTVVGAISGLLHKQLKSEPLQDQLAKLAMTHRAPELFISEMCRLYETDYFELTDAGEIDFSSEDENDDPKKSIGKIIARHLCSNAFSEAFCQALKTLEEANLCDKDIVAMVAEYSDPLGMAKLMDGMNRKGVLSTSMLPEVKVHLKRLTQLSEAGIDVTEEQRLDMVFCAGLDDLRDKQVLIQGNTKRFQKLYKECYEALARPVRNEFVAHLSQLKDLPPDLIRIIFEEIMTRPMDLKDPLKLILKKPA
jgi:hypothetical protein